MRSAWRAVAWIVLVVAGLGALLFVAVAIDHDGDPDLIIGGLALALVAGGITAGAWFVQRALGRPPGTASEQEAADPEELLERAARGETVILRPGRLKWALILLACLMCGIILLAYAVVDPHVLIVAGVLLFGFVGALAARSLLPGALHLRISPEGLEAKMPLRTRAYRWNDVENFRVFEVRSRHSTSEFVGFDLCALTPDRQSVWQTINRGVSSVDAGLPDNYGIEPEALAKALNRLRDRYATEKGLSPSERADLELAREAAAIDTSRAVIVTPVVALACVCAFVWAAARHGVDPSAQELLDIGAATRDASYWSLLTASFLHANVVHIAFNLIAWAVAGTLLEREVGAPRMVVLVIAGGLASMGLAILIQPGAVTLGLSGVVFAGLGWSVLRDPHRTRALGGFAWATLPVGVIYTFVTPGTSIGGHAGGLAAGLLLGWYSGRT